MSRTGEQAGRQGITINIIIVVQNPNLDGCVFIAGSEIVGSYRRGIVVSIYCHDSCGTRSG